MEFVLAIVAVVACIVGLQVIARRRRELPPAQAMAAALAKIEKAGDTELATQLETLCDRAARAKVAAINHLLPVAPESFVEPLREAQQQDLVTTEMMLVIGDAEFNLYAEGYVAVRHRIREVLMYRDQLLDAVEALGEEGGDEARGRVDNLREKLGKANDRLFELTG